MINVEPLESNIVKATIHDKIEERDINRLAPRVDALIAMFGRIRLLLDATAFEGWGDVAAARRHFQFVHGHQQQVERIALLAGQAWQQWIAAAASVFVHPEIRVFNRGEDVKALEWLRHAAE